MAENLGSIGSLSLHKHKHDINLLACLGSQKFLLKNFSFSLNVADCQRWMKQEEWWDLLTESEGGHGYAILGRNLRSHGIITCRGPNRI